MKPKIMVLWHTQANVLATCNINEEFIPFLEICDGDYEGKKLFYSYPLQYLFEYYGWEKIGEL